MGNTHALGMQIEPELGAMPIQGHFQRKEKHIFEENNPFVIFVVFGISS